MGTVAAVQNLKRIANALSRALRGWAWHGRFKADRSTDCYSMLFAIKLLAGSDATLHAA